MVEIAPLTDEHFKKVTLEALKPNRAGVSGNQLEILAGPILRFWGLESQNGVNNALWRGSVTYVTRDANSDYDKFPAFVLGSSATQAAPLKFAALEGISFWRYDLDLETNPADPIRVPYRLGTEHPEYSFWIPGQAETMRTMFYSCNGFSLAVDPKTFPGQMWEDVLRKHKESPFHVMLGGGDQLYCDSINLVLPENTLKNRGKIENEPKMRELINRFYLRQYIDWYGRGHWKGSAGETLQDQWVETLAQIPSLNIFDDHDIIDGFGTYNDRTMSSPIFEIIGEYAYVHYMLFQQNVGSPETDPKMHDSAWVTTGRPGPFIHRPAQSLYARLGKSAAFLGLDCRTERKKTQVCHPDSYKAMFARLKSEIKSDRDIKHIYLMLGVPIAYPRMVWAENLMSSKLIAPVKWLSKKGIILKGLVNPFDGDVELLDDLNDHWTAKHHKRERNAFLHALMALQKEFSVRVTILSGDVHLCGVGLFHSVKKTEPEHDTQFMVCPVSSAIVNTPPPKELSNFLNHRNRTHILGASVKERMLPVFDAETNGKHQNQNNTLMARRNYCILDPVLPGMEPSGKTIAGPAFECENDHTKNPSRHARPVSVVPGSIRMILQVEKDNSRSDATTVPYEMYIPTLTTR